VHEGFAPAYFGHSGQVKRLAARTLVISAAE